MSSAHTGVLHDASNPVISVQKTDADPKNRASRNAQRRLRSSLARGSDIALSFTAATSAYSLTVSTLRCSAERQDRDARAGSAFTVIEYCLPCVPY